MKTYPEGELPLPRRAPPGAPNILYIVLDDVGFGACETFGGLIETPHLSRLARGGLRYTNFHTTALCSPTRACLLSGRNHHAMGTPMNKAAIAAMLREHGYSSFAVGKWHKTAGEETNLAGPFDRWPDGPLFGFDRFYGFLGGDTNQWFPKLYAGREPIDQPRLPSQGYHLSEDLVDKTIQFIAHQESVDPDKPWLGYLAFGACHAPHHVWKSWIDKYKGRFDEGWDHYREKALERQKAIGLLPEHTELAPMLEGVPAWSGLGADEKKLYARMMETYAGFLSHADAQIGRLIEFLERTGDLDNTFLCVCIGDNGASGDGTTSGLFNQMSLATINPLEVETTQKNLSRLDQLGQPGSYNHFPVGWALAMNTPFKLCKQYTHLGATRNPLILHWPTGIRRHGEIRTQFHHVIDLVPTLLAAAGVSAPLVINSVHQEPVEGVAMSYSFDEPDAASPHALQHFEMLGNRAIVDGKWKAVTHHLGHHPGHHARKPWPWDDRAAFDSDHWELYDLEADPSECHDLMRGKDAANLSDPIVKRMLHLVELWWAEAGRYGILPLDGRFMERGLERLGLAQERTCYRFYPGTVRVPEAVAPNTLNRSWALSAEIEIPAGGAEGPLVAMGGDVAGWSLYLKRGVPTFCYNYAGAERTYISGEQPLAPGRHVVRWEFELRPTETSDRGTPVAHGAGGMGRLFVGKRKVAEGVIARTMAFGYCVDETFDIGCDKGSPVSEDYPAQAQFTGRIEHVDIDLQPDFAHDQEQTSAAVAAQTMARPGA